MKPVVIQGNVYFAAENDAELAKMLGAITSRKKKVLVRGSVLTVTELSEAKALAFTERNA